MRLVIGVDKHPAVSILLFNHLQNLLLGQRKGFFAPDSR